MSVVSSKLRQSALTGACCARSACGKAVVAAHPAPESRRKCRRSMMPSRTVKFGYRCALGRAAVPWGVLLRILSDHHRAYLGGGAILFPLTHGD
ncbi:hypothetical protein G6F58_013144 [Rhizopus delemar]|nr:hypothetical protein G6F58_013144 [Rhizopus delemar]